MKFPSYIAIQVGSLVRLLSHHSRIRLQSEPRWGGFRLIVLNRSVLQAWLPCSCTSKLSESREKTHQDQKQVLQTSQLWNRPKSKSMLALKCAQNRQTQTAANFSIGQLRSVHMLPENAAYLARDLPCNWSTMSDLYHANITIPSIYTFKWGEIWMYNNTHNPGAKIGKLANCITTR